MFSPVSCREEGKNPSRSEKQWAGTSPCINQRASGRHGVSASCRASTTWSKGVDYMRGSKLCYPRSMGHFRISVGRGGVTTGKGDEVVSPGTQLNGYDGARPQPPWRTTLRPPARDRPHAQSRVIGLRDHLLSALGKPTPRATVRTVGQHYRNDRRARNARLPLVGLAIRSVEVRSPGADSGDTAKAARGIRPAGSTYFKCAG
jgi:hypothetical protein